jgi:hypothetical protein
MPGVMRALAVGVCCAGIAGCGAAAKPLAQLRLQVGAPADGTRVTSSSIDVSGSVTPATGATVLVVGRSVPLTRGTFTIRVPLVPGTNIIDVLAGGVRARPAMAAVRVYRQVDVTVPDVSGDSPSSATRALLAVGLVPRIQNNGEFFDFLLPTSPEVCSTSPSGGRSVPPGSVVTVSTSKTC